MPEITKQDALRWLEMQRDAINTEIAYAAPDDKRQYHGNLKIVNWIVGRVNEMTAVEFLDVVNEECAKHEGRCESGHSPCEACAFYETCIYGECENTRRSVEIVRRWKEEQGEH